jgi:hypothetical protein
MSSSAQSAGAAGGREKKRRGGKPPAASPEPPAATAPAAAEVRHTEVVRLDSLRPHPRNYKRHPDDQLEHIAASIRQHGWYRNIVTARDGTILAGHGVALAAEKKLGLTEVPIFRLPVDPESPAALKILASDNELGKFAETDDRALSELLREVKETDVDGLLGTGFDETMLAGLVLVTRPASEIADFDEAAHYVGMPEYDPGEKQFKLVVTFPTEADREAFVAQHGIRIDKKVQATWGTRWPFTEREDVATLRFKEGSAAEGGEEAET